MVVRYYAEYFSVASWTYNPCVIVLQFLRSLHFSQKVCEPTHWCVCFAWDEVRWRDEERQRGVACILNSSGELVKPSTPVELGICPGTGEKVKRWRRDVKKRNSSILARCSPKHTRLPGGYREADSSLMIRVPVMNYVGSYQLDGQHCRKSTEQTCWEWQEGVSPAELALRIQEMLRTEGVWSLPLVLIKQRRC